ncbi:MAG: CRTAC1 family protein, partial [Gammaproteobacteria bacterium]|nr:CRTAC1 family protein [Gammaproteobacteria bacterium]
VGFQRRQRRVQTAGSYLAANDPRVQFGLGYLPRVTGVEVRWPTGARERFGDFEAGTTTELRRGAGQALDVATRE